jgi:hypothetical protein
MAVFANAHYIDNVCYDGHFTTSSVNGCIFSEVS